MSVTTQSDVVGFAIIRDFAAGLVSFNDPPALAAEPVRHKGGYPLRDAELRAMVTERVTELLAECNRDTMRRLAAAGRRHHGAIL